MYNKKGAIAAEEVVGMLTFVFVAAVMMLVFWGCEIKKATQEYEHLEDLKFEIGGVKDINFFLLREHPQDSEKLVLDLVIESYLADDYADINSEAIDFLSKNYYGWQLKIGTDYDSHTYNNHKTPDNTCLRGYSEIFLPYMNEEFDFAQLKVILSTHKRCDT
tara:strand:- start:72 stop:557 length:486 start_codon:yes stop_codon:yes gene_type:complete